MEVFSEALDIAELLEKVAERWSRNSRLQNRKIILEVRDAVGVVDVDPGKLEQVLDSLIDNAVRYAPGGDIELVACAAPKGAAPGVEISVRDRGPGISSDMLPTLFETFNDIDDVSGSKYGGAGLGLPLSYRLCRLMLIRLAVNTVAGVGTVVTLSLPRPKQVQSADDSEVADLAQAA